MGAHDIDLWFNASTATYPTSSKIPNTHVVLTPFTQYSYIGFNNQRAPTNELAVRRAIAYATDRKRLIDTVSYGVQVLNEGDQPRFLWAYDAALRSLPYDPAQARAMLDEAGWKPGPDGIRVKNGQRLHLVFVTSTGSAMGNRVGVLLQSAYRDIGLEMEVKSYATALLFASYAQGGILQTGKYDAQFASWVNGVDPDDSTTLTCDAIPPNGQNSIRFCNAEVDAQERIAMIHYDRPTRKKAYDRIQEILVDQVPALTMWFARRYDIVSDDVKNYKPAHAVSTFWNTWEYEI
jgi:peptide/nickel transport system substrate-binding protein